MYKWLIAGCSIGFGLGLLFVSMIFEMALSSFGNPLTKDQMIWDWGAQTNTWKLIGIMWILAGLVALYLLYRVREKASPSSNPSSQSSSNPQKASESIIVEIAKEPAHGETSYFKQRETTITMKTLEDLVKIANQLKKPILFYKKESAHVFYVIENNAIYHYKTTAPTKTK